MRCAYIAEHSAMMGMKDNLDLRRRSLTLKLIMAANGVLLLLLAFMALIDVFSSDDYWYSTFWDHGLRHYIELMDYHYAKFNGRVVVHMVAHVILHFENWAFALCFIGMGLAASMVVSNTFRLGSERFQLTLFCLLAGLFCMPLNMFNEGIMWISGWCNYFFPVMLVCLLVAALEKGSNWAYLLAFLCGATTEQMGLASAALCVVFVLFALLRKQDIPRCVGCMLLAAMGVLTIFLSPATQNRAEVRMPLDDLAALMELMRTDLEREARLWFQTPAPVCVMIAVLVLGAMILWRRYGLRWPSVMAGVSGAALAGCGCFESAHMAGFVVGAGALAILSLVLMYRDCSTAGGLILTAIAAAAVMLPTNTIVPRAMVPIYLLLLLGGCSLLTAQMKKTERMGLPVLALLLVTLVYIAPTARGYWQNYQIDQINQNYAIEDADKAYVCYCAEYDMRYAMPKADTDGYFKMKYLESIGRQEDTPLLFFGLHDEPVTVFWGEQELGLPAVRRDGGTALLPLREIIESVGGRVDWSLERFEAELDAAVYRLHMEAEDSVVLKWKDQSENEQVFCGRREMINGSYYFDLSVFTEAFGLTVEWDPDQGCYHIGR